MTTDTSSKCESFQSKPESRRDVLKTVVVAAAAPLVAAVPTSMEACAKPAGGGIPTTEGVFLICEKEHRIFFIRSVYLPYFEVTDLYPTEDNLHDIVTYCRNHSKDKWRVLYSDDDDIL